ncbi:STAS domain-containing protein [Streptomyces sp. M3]|uniref:STAS domain-containing protein n=1 Tax=Streptomyces sp. M3 TaxID=295102 RepID=UPI0013E954EA|nr:STAS domain-containing protein [Streptomyces sp. M3]
MPEATSPNSNSENNPEPQPSDSFERVATVRLVGDVVASTADVAAAQLRAPLSGNPDIIDIDMSAVTYLNSAGGHAFVSLIGAAVPAGVRLVIRDASPEARSALHTLGLDRFFEYIRAD